MPNEVWLCLPHYTHIHEVWQGLFACSPWTQSLAFHRVATFINYTTFPSVWQGFLKKSLDRERSKTSIPSTSAGARREGVFLHHSE